MNVGTVGIVVCHSMNVGTVGIVLCHSMNVGTVEAKSSGGGGTQTLPYAKIFV